MPFTEDRIEQGAELGGPGPLVLAQQPVAQPFGMRRGKVVAALGDGHIHNDRDDKRPGRIGPVCEKYAKRFHAIPTDFRQVP